MFGDVWYSIFTQATITNWVIPKGERQAIEEVRLIWEWDCDVETAGAAMAILTVHRLRGTKRVMVEKRSKTDWERENVGEY